MNYYDYLSKSSEEFQGNLQAAKADFEHDITDMLLKLEVLTDFLDHFNNIDSCKVLSEVQYDLFSAIYLALNGMYRNSFVSLRSASELGLGFLYFTDYNYHYQQWKKMKFDLKWSVLSDSNEGILSQSYLTTYVIFSSAQSIIDDYQSVYRYCSEFVHGKYEFMHTLKNPKIEYDKATFKLFVEKFNLLTDLLFALLIIRFNSICKNLREDNYNLLIDYSKRYSLNSIVPDYGK